jgi:hypothetical protein
MTPHGGIKFQEMVDTGAVHDYADLARLGYVTRARITQIMNLLLFAPDIQEGLLLPSPTRLPPTERQLRSAARHLLWNAQNSPICFSSGSAILYTSSANVPRSYLAQFAPAVFLDGRLLHETQMANSRSGVRDSGGAGGTGCASGGQEHIEPDGTGHGHQRPV